MQFINTDSGHCYDLDDVQSGLRYIAEQKLRAVPSHVLALIYNAIEHIERQDMLLRKTMEELIRSTNDQAARIAMLTALPYEQKWHHWVEAVLAKGMGSQALAEFHLKMHDKIKAALEAKS